jgi:heterodisulfide reductase subunit C2
MTILNAIKPQRNTELRTFVEAHIKQSISRCYQCGKCTAGCPVAYTMDLTPRQVLRCLQLGIDDELEKSSTMWTCLSCLTCSARCPREIDIAGVMEALRLATSQDKMQPDQRKFRIFHNLFIRSFQYTGRVYELGLGAFYNLLSGRLLNQAKLLPTMLAKGKMPIFPHKVKHSEMGAIMKRVKSMEKEEGPSFKGNK